MATSLGRIVSHDVDLLQAPLTVAHQPATGVDGQHRRQFSFEPQLLAGRRARPTPRTSGSASPATTRPAQDGRPPRRMLRDPQAFPPDDPVAAHAQFLSAHTRKILVELAGDLRIDGREPVCRRDQVPGAVRAARTCGPLADGRLPPVVVRILAAPPDLAVRPDGHVIRGERAVSFRIPLRQERWVWRVKRQAVAIGDHRTEALWAP